MNDRQLDRHQLDAEGFQDLECFEIEGQPLARPLPVLLSVLVTKLEIAFEDRLEITDPQRAHVQISVPRERTIDCGRVEVIAALDR